MESYKRVALSLMLLLSTPLSTFCMEGDFDGVHHTPISSDSKKEITPPSSPRAKSQDDNLTNLDDDDETSSAISQYYTPRASITYTGLDDFDKRSVDDLTTQQAYQALIKQLNAVAVTTPPAGIPAPHLAAGVVSIAGAAASLASGVAPAIRSHRTSETKTPLLLIAGWLASACKPDNIMEAVDKYKFQLVAITLAGGFMLEARKSAHMEEENKTLTRKVHALDDAVRKGLSVIKKHELLEHGLVATEHKLLTKVHLHLCAQAALIAKGSQPNQAAATLKSLLESNKKITVKVVNAMADLEKIHTDSGTLLIDEKEYSALDPRGWFKALKDMCHKHSVADDLAAMEAK